MFPILDVTRRTLDIIRERGWCYKFSAHSSSPINLRSAVSRACTQLCTDDLWHATYALTIKAIAEEIQRDVPEDRQQGVTDWEFGSRNSTKKSNRTQVEVEAMLEKLIQRLESDEETGSGHPGGRSASARTNG